jgi:glyoxylase-like metal-dependent hydrolase (beta-lactamase superfamily II)
VVLIHGHTPGSIALLDRDNRMLLGGDSIQTGAIFMFGPGRNVPAYVESMRKLDAMRNAFDVVYPSHGEVPVSADIIPALVKGARRLLAGELSATKPDRPGLDAMLYDAGVAKFLYP